MVINMTHIVTILIFLTWGNPHLLQSYVPDSAEGFMRDYTLKSKRPFCNAFEGKTFIDL